MRMETNGVVAGVPLFVGSNYRSWKCRMLAVLDEHELEECIQQEAAEVEELKVKEEDTAAQKEVKLKAAEKRKKKEKRCRSFLLLRLDDDHVEQVQDKSTPREIWLALTAMYERQSLAKRLHLKQELILLRQGGDTLREHFTKFDRIIRELKSTGATIDELDVICHLLLTVNPRFEMVVTSIQTVPERDLSLEFVKCRLLDEKTRKNSSESVGVKTGEAAFSGTSALKSQQQKKKKAFKCFVCGKEGHKAADCPEKKSDATKASARYGSSDDEVCFVGVEKLPELREVSWIVDSGSSEHIAKDRELFEELVPLKNPVTIAVAKKGKSIVAEHRGVIRLTSAVDGKTIPIALKDVLYIPEASAD